MPQPPVQPISKITAQQDFSHFPVLLEPVLSNVPSEAKVLADVTLGGGGHALALLERFPEATLWGSDRDPEAVEASQERLASHGQRCRLSHLAFSQLTNHLPSGAVDFMLADLGVSSPQLDRGERGFSFTRDGPLDMRMDPTSGMTAENLVNTASQEQLLHLLRQFGEERFAKRIVQAIESARPLTSTLALAKVVSGAVPARHHRRGHHPATRTFQALRMGVNDELGELEAMLDGALDLLSAGGRLAVISFHSLEDRLVKTRFRQWESPCHCPPSMPRCICGQEPLGRRVTHKPIVADAEEQAQNPRSRSAKLRVFEKKT